MFFFVSVFRQKRLAAQEEAKRIQKEDAKAWRQKRKAIKQRIAQRPLLLEREKMEAERKKAKKKALLLVRQSLEKSGITAFKDFFSAEELAQMDEGTDNIDIKDF